MKVAIAGFGQEGKANYRYWSQAGNDVTIVDERDPVADLPQGVATILGAGAFSKLEDFDMVVRTASLRPDKIVTRGMVWSATNEFFEKCPAPIIGVTGTKGKGTTSSLIASVLRAAGKTVHLVGNIGVPALAELGSIQPDDVVVYELSSFQLWDIQKSPHVAVVLMIEADHLDVHASMEEYVAAKGNIVKWQHANDVVIYNQHNTYATQIAELSPARKLPFGGEYGDFHIDEIPVAARNNLQLPGAHNMDNANAAILAAWQFTQDTSAFAQGLKEFGGLEHRLKFVGEVDGVEYYDDSIATTPGSAIAALYSFTKPKVIILGGYDKGADYSELLELCEKTATKVVAVGQIGQDIADLCEQIGVVYEPGGDTMQEIVAKAAEIAQPGDVVILSPAAASFDMFKDYKDRGNQFVAAMNRLQTQ